MMVMPGAVATKKEKTPTDVRMLKSSRGRGNDPFLTPLLLAADICLHHVPHPLGGLRVLVWLAAGLMFLTASTRALAKRLFFAMVGTFPFVFAYQLIAAPFKATI